MAMEGMKAPLSAEPTWSGAEMPPASRQAEEGGRRATQVRLPPSGPRNTKHIGRTHRDKA
eukprot:2738737-Alexandrium_andersonii.AAC.1